jgi:uncharacterized repeat protein (TIGR03803 family)
LVLSRFVDNLPPATLKEKTMRFRICSLGIALLMMTIALSTVANAQAASTESTIYTFSETGSFWPQGGLIEDASGNFYGTTRGGGTYGVGTVMELSPPAVSGNPWTLTTLYNFVPYGSGGYVPISDLVKDQAGAFYGTTYTGGDPICNCGVVYKLVPPAVAGGPWTQSQLYAFKGGADGRLPALASLALTTKGTLYGVTTRGGTWDSGVLFQLTTKTGKTYTESVLYSFGDLADASTPSGAILLDSAGSLYGVTSLGGAFGQGTLYKYVPAANGQLATYSILYSFGGSTTTGSYPNGSLIFDAGGNIYGVTNGGGDTDGDGVVYSLARANPTWTESILYAFNTTNGTNPVGGLTWNHKTNQLYGTSSSKNQHPSGDGSIFQLTPPTVKGGAWTELTLFQFTYRVNGGYPTGPITLDSKTGIIYGTALNGGIEGCDLFCGTIWQIANP